MPTETPAPTPPPVLTPVPPATPAEVAAPEAATTTTNIAEKEKSQPAFSPGNVLVVTVVEGKALMAGDPWGTSDPYCVLRLGAQQQKTKVLLRTLCPQWNETLTFPITDAMATTLNVSVWDSDKYTSDDPLGSCSYDCSTLNLGTPRLTSLAVIPNGQNQAHGELKLSLLIEAGKSKSVARE